MLDKIKELILRRNTTSYYNPNQYNLDNEFNKYQTIVGTGKMDTTALFQAGRLYQEQENVQLAFENYEKALDIDPTKSEIHYNLGNLYDFREIKFQEAVKSFEKAVELNKKDVYAINARNTYCKIGKYHQAIEQHQHASKLRPNDAFACKGLGTAYLSQQDYINAIENFKKALEIQPNLSDRTLYDGKSLSCSGQNRRSY